ncbi:MAG: 16S rRNA processing protein RimM [Deltaproteobacteria bacterium]|uniref:Ribosome maturation factor RimM n=1 Tax=Candidatus Zymogenus saltonus TaxID=2844893 RepID=A0A9D8KF32_9DELT|nr:16S rRNA processing protein RimM [Candidatus Zymogenus saltonus]
MSREIVFGQIVKPHGIKGAVKVKSYAESPESFLQAKRIRILRDGQKDGDSDESPMESTFTVLNAGGMGQKVILKLQGLDSRDDAEALVGSIITVRREDLPETDEDEYYWDDLIGMEVYDVSGKYLGIIKKILETGSNDVYIVGVEGNEDTNEILVPGTRDAVREVNVPEKRMIIEPEFGPVFNAED